MKEALALASAGGVSCDELRDALAVTKTVAGVVAAAQTHLASAIAKTERHGDGGTGVLAETTGLTRREARGQVKTAKAIAGVPSVRDAVAQGRVSLANAKRLADAVERTSAGAVEADGGLLQMAESMRADEFTKEARRWIAEQQDDGGEADYQRRRAKRCVRVWNSDNGMVELHGTFDSLTGQRIGNRLRAEANRLYQNDKKHASAYGSHEGSGSRQSNGSSNRNDGGSGSGKPNRKHAGDGRRTYDQCMADALDNLTSNTTTATSASASSRSAADSDTGTLISHDETTRTKTRHATDTGTTTDNNQTAHTSTEPTTGDQDNGVAISNDETTRTKTRHATDTGTTTDNNQTAHTSTEPTTGDQDNGVAISNDETTRTNTGHAADTGTTTDNSQTAHTSTERTTGDQDNGVAISNDETTRTNTGHAADTGTTTDNSQTAHTSTERTTGDQDNGVAISNGETARTGTGNQTRSGADSVNKAGVADDADPGTCTCRVGADNGAGVDSGADGESTRLGRAFADICVIVQVDAATGEVVAQLPDGERLPDSVLDKLTCNARLSVILSTARGQPIWRAIASRAATKTQRRLLLARWGGCFHCAAHPAMCQIHHIVPVAQGGKTKIDNLIPVCWECHDLIHHNHWQIHKRPDGNHTLHPPNRRHHGPAHAPEQPLLFTQTSHNNHDL